MHVCQGCHGNLLEGPPVVPLLTATLTVNCLIIVPYFQGTASTRVLLSLLPSPLSLSFLLPLLLFLLLLLCTLNCVAFTLHAHAELRNKRVNNGDLSPRNGASTHVFIRQSVAEHHISASTRHCSTNLRATPCSFVSSTAASDSINLYINMYIRYTSQYCTARSH